MVRVFNTKIHTENTELKHLQKAIGQECHTIDGNFGIITSFEVYGNLTYVNIQNCCNKYKCLIQDIVIETKKEK